LDCKLLMIDVAARERAVDEDSVAEDARSQPALSEGGQMFANRLKKNQKSLARWLKQSGTTCYRLYDADMPEYALAIDIYGRHVHVQEYTPPKSVDASQAQRRLMDALAAIPQVLGCSPNDIHIKQRTRQAGKAQYTRQDSSGQRIEVQEGDARLWVNLKDYLDTGLFLDHRPVRKLLGKEADGKRVLNLFCYTATATVHAVLGGASESVSVDMSNTYLDWGRENFKLNGISEKRHQLVRADCLKWLERSREEFDLIFLDPPTFSNSKKMEGTLDIQRDHARLIDLAMASLAPGGTLIFSNNHRRFVMDDSVSQHHVVEDLSRKLLDPDFKRRPDIHHVFRIRRASDVKG
ncbi:MAG: bifunctional 23S rRNA (guanine(2069)-N(7))-methyltransferase RlmK/23S rRNA (guanine(2445)-N(2))-methyltransferase RlmL, partial [Cobetia sp.]